MVSKIRSDRPTHTGTVRHKNPNVHAVTVKLTEATDYWITPSRTLYRKSDGRPRGCGPSPLWNLDIETVKEIDS